MLGHIAPRPALRQSAELADKRAELRSRASLRALTWYRWLWIRGRDSTTIFQANISWYSLYLHSSMGGFK